jgi:hypothetical protein
MELLRSTTFRERLSMKTKFALLAFVPLALGTLADAQAPKPPQSAQTTEQQAQPKPTQITILQVCQRRQEEIVALNLELFNRNQAAAKETDQTRRAQIVAPLQNLAGNLKETEASWQRMDCARMLFNAR